MARYINLDKLLKGLEDELKDKNPDDIAYLVFKLFIGRLSKEPTVDVVPKSEVFLASSDAMKMLIECHGYALTHDADIKKEVAREFIEAVDPMLDLVCRMTGLKITFFGKYGELRKKYTEVNDEKQS